MSITTAELAEEVLTVLGQVCWECRKVLPAPSQSNPCKVCDGTGYEEPSTTCRRCFGYSVCPTCSMTEEEWHDAKRAYDEWWHEQADIYGWERP